MADIQKAKITSVDHLTGVTEIKPHHKGKLPAQSDIPLPQPYAGRGWGIRAGVETDSIVLATQDESGSPRILGYQTDNKFFRDGAEPDLDESFQTEPQYKTLVEGEIVLQSQPNSMVFLNERGDVALSTSDGTFFELNKGTDSINQLSVNQTILTEATSIKNGLVRRDVRTEQEKEDDLFLSSLLVQDFGADENLDILGADSEHTISDVGEPLVGVFDTEEGDPTILEIPGIQDVPNADKIVQNITNPAITEYRVDVNEFADGVSSLNVAVNKDDLKEGRLTPNTAGSFVLGTVVDANGRMPRFDYVFGNGEGKGHGDIWKLPGINDTNASVDFKVNLDSSIQDAAGLGSEEQWISSGIPRFNTAQMFQLVLNTRGADHQGNIPDASNIGSRWALQVDKEGLTKWNIPAATSLNDNEQFRIGRSLLWNLDGSITQSIGKENNPDLESITEITAASTRRDRSWTADFEGSMEWRLGADDVGQSQVIEADGGLTYKYGKHDHREDSVVKNIDTVGLETPSKSGTKLGTSISGELEGSLEMKIGVDGSSQSVALHADGLMSITVGSDDVKDSLLVNTSGNIKVQSGGGHKFEMLAFDSPGAFRNAIQLQHGGTTASVIQIDSNGVITLRNAAFNTNIMISATGAINMINPAGKISLGIDGSVGLGGPLAGIDISPTTGVVLRTAGGSFTLDLIGKADIAANAGFTVTGTFAHLNTTATALSPAAPTSPFAVAVAGGGLSIDPFTGDSAAGASTIKV